LFFLFDNPSGFAILYLMTKLMTPRRAEVLSILVKQHAAFECALCSPHLGRALAADGLVTREKRNGRNNKAILTITDKGIQVMALRGDAVAKVLVG
jgi:hypothetical protein